MNMPINPMQFMQMVRGGGNPMQMIMGIAQSNPQLNHVIQMMNGKTPQQMEGIVRQFAQQRGVNLDQMAQQMGIPLPPHR